MTRDFTIWLSTLDTQDLDDLKGMGPVNGIPGMIYYAELRDLYAKYHQDIWDAVVAVAHEGGFPMTDILSNIVGNNCQSHDEFATNMVWFAATYYVQDAIDLKKHYQSFDKTSQEH